MGRGELKLSFQVLEEYKWEMGQAKCRGKSFLVTGNISYLVRYISNLVISMYVGVCVYIYMNMNNLLQDSDPDHRGAKESTEWWGRGTRLAQWGFQSQDTLRILDVYLQYNGNSKPGIGLDRGVTHSYLSFKDHLCLRVEKGLVGAKGKRRKHLTHFYNKWVKLLFFDDAKF